MYVVRRALLPAGLLFVAMIAVIASFSIAANAQVGITEAGVLETPRLDTMRVIDGEVLDSVVVGNRVIVVGSFTQVQDVGGSPINQPYIAAYRTDTGRFDGTFRPTVDNFINSIEASGNTIYIGGQFNRVGGEAHRKVARLNSDGSVNSGFVTQVDATVNSIDVAHGKVYLGGRFKFVNGQARESFAAVNATNGAVDSATDFNFETSASQGDVGVRWLEVSPNGSHVFISHSARRIDGQTRTGIARFNVSAGSTTLSTWRTLHFENELDRLPAGLRMRRLAISPDSSYLVIVTSGNDIPPTNDVAVRFPTFGGANIEATWVSRHFDTVLGVAINNDVVFVGGHFQFQEAPGSTNPFPGDPDTAFGFGGNQGPVILGDQVVQREQIGALNPNTGKSLDWNPGSNTFIGVQSLTWDDSLGLLIGHDGSRLGGVSGIGRHGVFPIGNTPTPVPTPSPGTGGFGCNATFSGGNATITFTGDRGSSLNLLRNGTWVASVTTSTTTISANAGDTLTARLRGPNYTNPFQDIDCTTGNGGGTPTGGTGGLGCNATFSGGNATITFTGDRGDSLQILRNGTWVASVTTSTTTISANAGDTLTARLRGPNYTNPFQDIDCTTGNGGGTPTSEITTTIGFPANGGVVTGGTVTISGEATAPEGLRRVRITVQRRSTREYLNTNNEFVTDFASLDFNLTGTSGSWEFDVELPFAGQYDLTARTFDVNGVRNDTVRSTFAVGVLDNEPPVTIVNAPQFSGSDVTFSGRAFDDIGVVEVSFLVQNRDTFEYFRRDGSVGAAERFDAVLQSPNTTSTLWSRTLSGLPDGDWEITVDSIDTTNQRDRSRRVFVAG